MTGSLTHSQADILRHLLVDLGAGTLPSSSGSWPIHVDYLPDTPDSAVAVHNTAGRYNGRSQTDGRVSEHQGIMVHIRGNSSRVAYAKTNTIKVLLDEVIKMNSVAINGSEYTVYAVSRTSGPHNLSRQQDSDRFFFTINAVVALRQTT